MRPVDRYGRVDAGTLPCNRKCVSTKTAVDPVVSGRGTQASAFFVCNAQLEGVQVYVKRVASVNGMLTIIARPKALQSYTGPALSPR